MKLIIILILLITIPYPSYASISHETKIALRLHQHKKALKLLKVQANKNNPDAQYIVIAWPMGLVQASCNPFKGE